MQNIKIANVAGKKDDPNYAPVRGHVPIDLYKKFKIFCLDRGVDNSEGLEQLLSEYFESKEQPTVSAPAAQPEPEKEEEISPRQQRGRELMAKRRAKNQRQQQEGDEAK